MRHSHGVQHAVLGVVSRNPEGIHGYAVRRQGERLLGHFWRLNFGEVYRILDRLAADGLIEQVADGGESARKVYRITNRGQRSLDDYVLSPQTDAPRPLRQELAVKLLFASPEHLPELLRLVARQRDAYMQELHKLGSERRKMRRAPFDAFVTHLLIDGAELSARAELSWLDEVAKRLAERYGASATRMIEYRNVTKVFGAGDTAVKAVNDLSFTIERGDFWSLMGPSGSGKSTVLHLIAGLTPPTSGAVLVEGHDVAKMSSKEAAELRRRRVGYVLQTFNLLPFLTAEENVGMPLVLDNLPQREVDTRVAEALETVKMAHRAKHHPTTLSGGEQQRVAIARALVIKPAIVLADEPTGNLDRANGRAVMDLMADLNERLGVTILLVTHDPVFAAMAKRVLRLVDGSLEQAMAFDEDDEALAASERGIAG